MATNYRKSQSLLLIKRLLMLQENLSPLNLILDNLEQSARSLLSEYIYRAKASGKKIVFVSFETPNSLEGLTYFVDARRKASEKIYEEVGHILQSSSSALVIIDSLNHLQEHGVRFLRSLNKSMTSSTSVMAVYHSGMSPVPPYSQYLHCPTQLALLKHLATTVVSVSAPKQSVERLHAIQVSRAEPEFGLLGSQDGIISGISSNSTASVHVVMEHRRKSGRTVGLSFVLATSSNSVDGPTTPILQNEYPLFQVSCTKNISEAPIRNDNTFSLELTERQRLDRNEVILPYLDAQIGDLQGGRILYDMTREDDFDEEEDEIL